MSLDIFWFFTPSKTSSQQLLLSSLLRGIPCRLRHEELHWSMNWFWGNRGHQNTCVCVQTLDFHIPAVNTRLFLSFSASFFWFSCTSQCLSGPPMRPSPLYNELKFAVQSKKNKFKTCEGCAIPWLPLGLAIFCSRGDDTLHKSLPQSPCFGK